jgi:ASC-1-like (ASCH) protein
MSKFSKLTTMKDIKLWLIVGLTVIIVLLLLFDKDPIPNESYIKEYESTIQRNESTIESLKVKHREDSLKSAQEVAELKAKLSGKVTEVKKLSSTVAHLRANPVVVQVIADVPEIDSLVQSYDSLLESKDDQIELQGRLIVSLEDENKRITGNFLERLELSQQNFDAQKAISDTYQKENKKLRRGNKLLKVGLVVIGVGGFVAGSQ